MYKFLEANLAHWDELSRIHGEIDSYGLESLTRGKSTLRPIERREFLPLLNRGSVLHLQCHIGLDSISLARDASRVVGVDFSTQAVATARRLGEDCGNLEFIKAEIDRRLPGRVGKFDFVFASYGVLEWIPDLAEWMEAARDCLNPGGRLYIVDTHPLVPCLVPATRQGHLVLKDNYFGTENPRRTEKRGSYADPSKKLSQTHSYHWYRGIGEIITATVNAGFHIRFLNEFPVLHYQRFCNMIEDPDGYWALPDTVPAHRLPMMFSMLGEKAGQ